MYLLKMEEELISLKEFIKKIVPISEIEAEEIASKFNFVEFSRNEHLLKVNQISDDYLFLQKGLMRAYLLDLEGNEITTEIFTQSNIVFEITSFFNRTRSEINIEAITECIGYRITYQELNDLFHNKPAFRDFGRAILVKEFIASKKKNYAMINQTAEERYHNLLTNRPEILKFVPLKYIASYLGITDSTLSRIRKRN